MTPEETFGQLLGLGKAWRVVEARLEASSSTFLLKVEETPHLWPEESTRAGTPVTCHDHVEPMQWRHLNVFNKECVIVCALPRGRRGDDGKVYRVTPPWEGRSKHFTQEFEAFAVTLMREMPVKRAAQILGESDTRMWRMLFAHVKAAHARLSFDTVVWVGADEMNRRKGHNYLAEKGAVLEIDNSPLSFLRRYKTRDGSDNPAYPSPNARRSTPPSSSSPPASAPRPVSNPDGASACRMRLNRSTRRPISNSSLGSSLKTGRRVDGLTGIRLSIF